MASVKPAANGATGGDGRLLTPREILRDLRPPGMIPMDDPGRVRLEDWALLDLIAAAYSVRATQVSGPAWLSGQGFDIEAKVADGTRKEELNAMLQSLLEERFGLKVHRGTQTRQGFALAVGKNGPKLKPAEPPLDPQKRIADTQKRMQENRENDIPRVGLTRMSVRSITTEELAARLVRFAEAPVVDETGLTGKYSVTIETWKNADVPGGTVFEAVERLGLKLEPRKLTVETVVVDQVSKAPTAN
ncbi:MAG TPA: TIGR03435 family protein [Bryobacteraceae bacterium]|nr:TIGR03435 family protein [Bryobacteraceae bacterium]